MSKKLKIVKAFKKFKDSQQFLKLENIVINLQKCQQQNLKNVKIVYKKLNYSNFFCEIFMICQNM